ncbi:MAG: hypothetical protein HUJ60_05035 [Bacilli bacterium]|nr:hypothetical protein [Bacilli bacterium]
MDEKNIKEAEIISTRVDEPKKQDAPTKVKSTDHARAIRFWGVFTDVASRFTIPGFVLSLLSGFALMILVNQGHLSEMLYPIMILAFVLSGLFLVGLILGMIGRAFLNHYKSKDPNFEKSIGNDNVF